MGPKLSLLCARCLVQLLAALQLPNIIHFYKSCIPPLQQFAQRFDSDKYCALLAAGDPKWDPEYMGSTMMAPVMLAVHMLWIAFAMVLGEL